jgi:aspartokinase/homoserine dehydrogenase 1
MGAALGRERGVAVEGRPGPADRGSAGGPDARVIPQLHLREAAELAYYGAKVLHPRALIPVAGRQLPVFVRPFARSERARHRDLGAPDAGQVSGQGAVGGGRAGADHSGRQRHAGRARHRGAHVRGAAPRGDQRVADLAVVVEQSICFSVPGGAGKRAQARLLEEFHDEIGRKDIDGIDVQDGLATVAVVGLGMAGHRGIAARVFAALADAGINIVAIAQGSSELNISFVVAAKDAAPAQRAVHAAFQLAKIGGGAATRASHRDVVLLGFGQIGRALGRHHGQSRRRARREERKRRQQAAAGRGHRHERFRVRAGRADRARGGRAGRRKQSGRSLARRGADGAPSRPTRCRC